MALLPLREMEELKSSNCLLTRNLLDSAAETSIGRGYCGMSGIGTKCNRAIQYSSRNASIIEIPARLSRIFRTGHMLEKLMVEDLERIGIEVFNQQAEIVGFAGHWIGHIDGECINVPEAPKTVHLLEMKTMKGELFEKLENLKIQKSNPKYYDQVQMYMHYRELTRTIFIVLNKNTSEYYVERIKYDKEHAYELVKKSEDILLSEFLFPRIGTEDSYNCKFCNQKQVCFSKIEVQANCRTCNYADLENNGVWKCSIDIKDLYSKSKEENFKTQMEGCKNWKKADILK